MKETASCILLGYPPSQELGDMTRESLLFRISFVASFMTCPKRLPTIRPMRLNRKTFATVWGHGFALRELIVSMQNIGKGYSSLYLIIMIEKFCHWTTHEMIWNWVSPERVITTTHWAQKSDGNILQEVADARRGWYRGASKLKRVYDGYFIS